DSGTNGACHVPTPAACSYCTGPQCTYSTTGLTGYVRVDITGPTTCSDNEPTDCPTPADQPQCDGDDVYKTTPHLTIHCTGANCTGSRKIAICETLVDCDGNTYCQRCGVANYVLDVNGDYSADLAEFDCDIPNHIPFQSPYNEELQYQIAANDVTPN